MAEILPKLANGTNGINGTNGVNGHGRHEDHDQQVYTHIELTRCGTVEELIHLCKLHSIAPHDLFEIAWSITLSYYVDNASITYASTLIKDHQRIQRRRKLRLTSDSPVLELLKGYEEVETPSSSLGADEDTSDTSSGRRFASLEDILASGTAVEYIGYDSSSSGACQNTKLQNGTLTSPRPRKDEPYRSEVVLGVKACGVWPTIALMSTTGILPQEQALRVLNTMGEVLVSLNNEPRQQLGETTVLSDFDRRTILEWNSVKPEVFNDCVHHIIKSRTDTCPDSIAISTPQGDLLYRELDDFSDRLATSLSAYAIRPESIIALCFEKSTWAIVAFLAAIKTGAAIVFLDPGHPEARHKEILSQIEPTLLLASPSTIDLPAFRELDSVCVTRSHIEECSAESFTVPSNVKPNNTLYVVFTSGSSGKPKGCVIEHGVFSTAAMNHLRKSGVENTSRVLQLTPYTFDVSMLEILTTLMAGACICIPDDQTLAKGFAHTISVLNINWTFMTPSLVRLLRPEEVPTLKTMFLGGEPLSRADIETWADHVALGNGYGPTECCVAVTGHSQMARTADPRNIGKGVSGICWIVDPDNHDRLMPIGAVGELLIEGCLARGYFKDPVRTAGVFIEDPMWSRNLTGTASKRRFYKTGDLVRYDIDGSLLILGRKDHQVKLRGQRLELGEIEHHLSRHPDIWHALVVLPSSGPLRKRLTGVISLRSVNAGQDHPNPTNDEIQCVHSDSTSQLQSYLAERLPSYMVPADWVAVDAIPLTTSGKLDRVSLSRWISNLSDATYREFVLNTGSSTKNSGSELSPNEALLQELCAKVLGQNPSEIPMDKPFLGIGGDSISGMQLMSQCRAKGVSISVKDLISGQTLSYVAQTMRKLRQGPTVAEEVFEQPFELSPIQRLFFSFVEDESLEGDELRVNQSTLLRFTKQVSIAQVQQAVDLVVATHSMLRVRFMRDLDGTWKQMIPAQVQGSYVWDHHGVQDSAAIKSATAQTQRALSILAGPVFAAEMFTNSSDSQQYLFLVAHHLAVDLVSWRIVLGDLEELLLSGTITGQKPLPFQSWVKLQTKHAEDHLPPEIALPFEVGDFDYDFWGMQGRPNMTSDVIRCETPFGENATKVLLGDEVHVPFHIQDRDIPPFFREGHGREAWDDDLDLSRTVGWFTTIFPIYVDREKTRDLLHIVRTAKDVRRTLPAKGSAYFASRYLNVQGRRAFAGHKCTEVVFDYVGQYQQLEKEDSLFRMEYPVGQDIENDVGESTQRFPLIEITAQVVSGSLSMSFFYNKTMRHCDRIVEWSRAWPSSLEQLMTMLASKTPEFTLSDVPGLGLTPTGLQDLSKRVLEPLGLSDPSGIEEIFPCSPIQEVLLLSQAKSPGLYEYSVTVELLPNIKGATVDVEKLEDAWRKVVSKHTTLRTILSEKTGLQDDVCYIQIVLKNFAPQVTHMSGDEAATGHHEEKHPSNTPLRGRPAHRFSVQRTTDGRVYCRVDINHAVIDGSSMPIIVQDLSDAYKDRLSLAPGLKYSDYVSFTRNQFDRTAALGYWTRYLEELDPCLFPASRNGEDEVRLQRLEFDTKVSRATLNQVSRDHNLSIPSIFQAAWALVLRQYTCADDVCFGLLSAGRDAPLPGIENATGAYITMLPRRMRFPGDLTTQELIQQMQDTYMDSLPHQYCGLADIQHALDMPASTLFNTILSIQKDIVPVTDKTENIRMEIVKQYDPTEYDISFAVNLSDDHMETSFGYWTSHLSEKSAQRIALTFSHTLRSMLQGMDKAVRKLNLVSHADKTQLQTWNTPYVAASRCIHDDFVRYAAAHPEAPAVSAWDGNFTYRALDDLSDRLADYLYGLGIRQNDIVLMCFTKSKWTLLAMLGVLKAGGACAMLDPDHPQSRNDQILDLIEARIMLISAEYTSGISTRALQVVSVDQKLLSDIVGCEKRPQTSYPNPHSRAFLVFTSGTTGVPKAIVLEHASVCVSSDVHGKAIGVGPKSRVLQFAAYTFDVSLKDIFFTLQRGGCVCVISEHERKNDLAAAIGRTGANFANITSTVASIISPQTAPTIKSLALGGEAARPEVVEAWYPHATVMNSYGPAECSITSACGRITHPRDTAIIGRSDAALLWVVNPTDCNELCPIGAVGELLIEGPLLSRGYYKDAAKTEEAFIHNPNWVKALEAAGDRRFYKTGDLVQYTPDGRLVYLGRCDTQVKIHGQRVEIGEIEHHIRSSSPVILQGVAVDLIEHEAMGNQKVLAAFLCPDTTATDQESQILPISDIVLQQMSDLQAQLTTVMPTYMVPALYIVLNNLPTTTSYKLDRRRMQKMATSMDTAQLSRCSLIADASRRAPTTASEKQLRGLWAMVLGMKEDNIGVNDNFFRLGGDSVQAMRLVSSARKHGVLLTVSNIFGHPLLSAMADQIEFTDAGEPAAADPNAFDLLPRHIARAPLFEFVASECSVEFDRIEDVYPCTPLQEAILAISHSQPGSYLSETMFRVSAGVSVERLKKAWNDVVQRHAMLRTRFINYSSYGTLQVVVKEDLRSERQINQGPGTSFYGKRLAHFDLVGLKDKTQAFKLTLHHALYDGHSINLLCGEVEMAYREGTTSSLPPFSRFVSYLSKMDVEAASDFWRSRLAGLVPSTYPPLPALDYQPSPKSQCNCQISTVESLRGAIVTAASVLNATWGIVTSRYTGSDTVIFGSPSSGRGAPVAAIDQIIGPTLTTVPTKISLNPEARAVDFLHEMQRKMSETLPFEHFGLQRMRKLHGISSEATKINSILVIQPYSEAMGQMNFLGLEQIPTPRHAFDSYALVVECGLSDQMINLEVRYDDQVILPEQAKMILVHFEHVFQQLSTELGSTPSNRLLREISMFSSADEKQILEWNEGKAPVVKDCIHTRFMAQARKSPHAQAICSWEGDLSYQELDKLSSLLAGHLQQLGVGPEALVPLCFEKSMWTIVSMLAILKAGGACVPLNPSDPQSRLELIITDLQPAVILVGESTAGRFSPGFLKSTLVVSKSSPEHLSGTWSEKSSLATPENAAFVLYTSGTTGVPKGIVLGHTAICTALPNLQEAFKIDASSRIAQFASYTFDVSTQDIFISLLCGACVCVLSENERMDDIAGGIKRTNASFINMTTSVAMMLDPATVKNLRTVTLAGEAVSADVITRWAPHVSLVNSYGPTEVAMNTTCHTELLESDPTNVGRGLAVQTWVVDSSDYHQLCPVGVVGELLIEGPLLARGYLNDPTKTSESFISNPRWASHGDKPSGQRRMYRTGDLVRYNTNGTLIYLGRRDAQVKIHGQRVEVQEIEHHISAAALPGIQNVAVEVVTPVANHERLAAFLSMNSASRTPETRTSEASILDIDSRLLADLSELQNKLRSILPTYMVPSLFIPVESMKISSAGKLDRRWLKSLVTDLDEAALARHSLAEAVKRSPTTSSEMHTRSLWSEVLGISEDSIGLDDNFFRLGGDSVQAMRLVTAARSKGITLTVATIFQSPQLASMAQSTEAVGEVFTASPEPFDMIGGRNKAAKVIEAAALECDVSPDHIKDILPCTPLQEGFVALTSAQSSLYSSQAVFKLPTHLSEARLKELWGRVVALHDILRTRVIHHGFHGTLQVLIDEGIRWRGGSSLSEYLDEDRQIKLHYGAPLARYGYIEDRVTKDRFFVLSLQHALYDGHSMSLISTRAEQILRGEVPSIPPPFSRFVAYLASIDPGATTKFWQRELSGDAPSSFPRRLRTDYRPQATQRHREPLLYTRKESSSITLATLLRGAWAILLSRQSGSSDVVFATPSSGRSAPVLGIEDIVGPTLSTVPVKVAVTPNLTVASFLQNLQRQATDMIRYENIGLQHLRRIEGVPAEALDLRNMLVVQPILGTEEYFKLLDLERVSNPVSAFDAYAVTFECGSVDGVMQMEIRYDKSIVSKSEAKRIMSQFQHIVHQLAEESSTETLERVDLLSAADRKQILAWNDVTPEVVQQCIPDGISERAEQQPQAPAICSWDCKLTFEQFDTVTSQLAAYLQNLGVGPETLVPVVMEKSAWAIVAMVGIHKAGGACAALNPEHPPERLKLLVGELNSGIILSDAQNAQTFDDSPYRVITVNPALFDANETAMRAFVRQDNQTPGQAAFVVFTSGSAGQPKGIVLSHQAMHSSLHAQGLLLSFGSTSRVLQFSAFTFDMSITEIFCTLLFGGCVCIPSPQERLNDLSGAINRMDVNWAFLTPTVADMLEPESVENLQCLFLAGEAPSRPLLEKWQERVRLLNGYGPSEAAVFVAIKDGVSAEAPANIGSGTWARRWVADAEDPDRLAPIGAIGELLIEGPMLARGYLNNPTLTEDSFIYDPKWVEALGLGSGRRLYRTGDLVRYDPSGDGSLLYVGRRDTQVKIHGQRAELGEVEYSLSLQDAVSNVVTLVPKEGLYRDQLVAVLSLHDSAWDNVGPTDGSMSPLKPTEKQVADLQSIRDEMYQQLPRYMVPNQWILLPSMPMNASRKIDRRRISIWIDTMTAEVYHSALDKLQTAPIDPASTRLELLLVKIWSKVLNVPPSQIGVNQSFIGLGGDSITAMQVQARCRKQEIPLFVKDILLCRSLGELATLAAHSQSLSGEASSSDAVGTLSPTERMSQLAERGFCATLHDFPLLDTTEPGLASLTKQVLPAHGLNLQDVEDIFACSPIQRAIVLSQLKDASLYRITQVCEVTATDSNRIEAERFVRAWHSIVQRHSSLRTIFVQVESTEAINTFAQVVLKTYDEGVTLLPCDTEDVVKYLQARPRTRWGPSQPPHHFTVCQSPAGRVFFKIEIDHTLVDGTSMAVLGRDLQLAYTETLPQDRAAPYSGLVQYLQLKPKDESIQYWETYLSDAEPCRIPTVARHGEHEVATYDYLKLDLNSFDNLRPFCAEHHVTLANVFQVAWASMLRCFTGMDEVCFGYLTSGRDVPITGIDDAVGAYISVMVCRVDTASTDGIGALVKKAQQDYLQALKHQHVALHDIHHRLGLDERGLFNTELSLQRKASLPEDSEIGIGFTPAPLQNPTEYDMILNISVDDKAMDAVLTYRSSSVDPGMATQICQTFEKVLSVITDASTVTNLGEINLLSPAHQQLLLNWHESAPPGPTPCCLHDIFAAQAKQQPADAPAIYSRDGTLSYSELDDLSSRLAAHLRGLGVGPEKRIPLCFDKSINAIVTMMAVLRAGGAVAALNPQYPKDRFQYILDTLGSNIVLTDPNHKHLFDDSDKYVVQVTRPWVTNLPPGSLPEDHTVTPNTAAFIVFTSGSTGEPKGIVLEHASIYSSLRAQAAEIGISTGSRVLQYSAFTFDVYITEVFTTLLSGGCVCVPREDERLEDLAGAMNRMQVNLAFLTASIATLLQPYEVPTLKRLILGGEAVKPENISDWGDQVDLITVYGPAECSVWTTINRHVATPTQASNIGRSLCGSTWVVDALDHNRLCPIGVVGELLVEGPLLARGYLGDKAKTRQAFITDPAWVRQLGLPAGRRLYKTGDLVHHNIEDGTLSFVGRRDTQVKIHGQRVELGEIENQIASAASAPVSLAGSSLPLQDVAVVMVEPPSHDRRQVLAAFLCLDTPTELSAADADADDGTTKPTDPSNNILLPMTSTLASTLTALQTTLTSTLPGYMVPALFLPLTHMPTTTSGKLDRRHLQRLVATQLSPQQLRAAALTDTQRAGKRAPSTPAETRLREVWAEVLGLEEEEIGADDHFFRLGGDSVRAMRLVGVARRKGLVVSVAMVFRKPVLREMARDVGWTGGKEGGEAGEEKEEADDDEGEEPQPFGLLSFA